MSSFGGSPALTRSLGGGYRRTFLSPGVADLASPSGITIFVDSNNVKAGTTERYGSQDTPYSTVAAALANRRLAAGTRFSEGCTILVADGHTESIAAADGWTMPDDRTSIIGLGVGNQRPLISFTTATTASIDIAKLACRLENLRFLVAFDAVTECIDIVAGGAGAMILDCEFKGTSTKEAVTFIQIVGATVDEVIIDNCRFIQLTAGANEAIKIEDVVDDLIITNNFIFGEYLIGCIHSDAAHINCEIAGNRMCNLDADQTCIEFSAAATGMIHHNIVNGTLAAVGTRTAIDPGSCYCNENYGSDAVGDVSGVLNPVADA